MIWIWLLAVLACAWDAQCLDEKEIEAYYQMFEEIDPDLILDNERILQAYLKCFYDEGPCNSHAQLEKQMITEVLSTVCGKCSPKQKDIFKYCLNKFVPSHPADWERILSIYDPKGEARPKIEAFMKS